MVGVVAGASAGWTIGSPITGRGGGGGARTGVRTCASTGASGCNCSLSGSSCAVLVDFLCLEEDVPRVLLRQEPVFLPPFLGFPIVPGIGEAGVDVHPHQTTNRC